jgi:Icc-related predicted phosphoesterase
MKILAISDLHEEFAYFQRFSEAVKNTNVEAIVFTGNILHAEARRAEWERAHAEHRAPDMNQPEVAREHGKDVQSINWFFKNLIIKTYEPHFALCSRRDGQKGKLVIANTLVVCPGQLRQGDYAVLDTNARKVEFGNLR